MIDRKLLRTGQCLATFALLTILGGCVKRGEMIAVLPDGRVELVTYLHGGKGDVLGGTDPAGIVGDPTPSAENGWSISEGDSTQHDGKNATLMATMSLAPGEKLPTTYATPNTAIASAATQFNTQVSIEKTDKGTYYHFKRTYVRRRWAPFEYHRHRILESDKIKKLMENDPESMSQQDRKTVVKAMIDVATEQQIELFNIAVSSTETSVSQLAQLSAQKRIREIASEPGIVERVMAAMMTSNGPEDATAIEKDLNRRVDTGIKDALTQAGTNQTIASGVIESLHKARRDLEVSKDLEDESWAVQVILPGKIIAHNGTEEPESIGPADLENTGKPSNDDPLSHAAHMLENKLKPYVESPGFQNYTWGFEFDALLDRDVVLMATSFVPNK